VIKSFYYVPGNEVQVIEGITDFDRMVRAEGSVLWVDMCRPSDEESFVLTHDFKFHPLAIEDVLSERARSKIDDYDSYLFVVMQLADYAGRDEELKVGEVDLFLNRRSLVTVHYDDHRIFDYLYHRAERDERLVSRGADFLFHAVVDTIVDNYNTALDIIEYDVDEIERDILDGESDQETLRSVFTIRRDIVQLKRIVMPQTEVLTRLSRGEFDLVSQKAAVYFSDVHDHLARINDIADSQREILNSSLEVYYSSVSTKTNEIIKFLTIVTVLFMPPTFLVGLWGMNFEFMPELEWEFGYHFALIIMLLTTLGLIIYFRRKKWL